MKNYNKTNIFGIISLLLIVSLKSFAGSLPYSFENRLSSVVKTFELKSFNNDSLIRSDSGCTLCGGKFGIGFPEDIDLQNSGSWDILKNGDKVWRLKIASKTAVGLKINWDRFDLPAGAILYVTDGVKTVYKGPVTLASNPKKVFTTGNMNFKELTIEYDQPGDVSENPMFHISEIVYIYKKRKTMPMECAYPLSTPPADCGYGSSASCHNNVNCVPWVTDNCTDIRATVMYDFEYQNPNGTTSWGGCSGVLLNNTALDFTPYILTANHCVSEHYGDYNPRINPGLWIVYFNWQSPDCYDAYGNIVSTMVGVEIKATGACNAGCPDSHSWYPDMALLLAYYNPPALPLQYNMYFAGWSRLYNSSDLGTTNATSIGHPNLDIKKIYDGTVHDEYYDVHGTCDGCCCYNSHLWEFNPSNGFEEGGSSGSPLFNSHHVLGTLSGEPQPGSNCDNFEQEDFGCLGDFWSSVSSYLDPAGTGFWSLDGLDPIKSCQNDITLEGNHWPALSWQQEPMITIQASHTILAHTGISGPAYIQSYTPPGGPTYYSQYVYSAGDAIDLKPGFGVDLGNSFKAVIAGCQAWSTDCGFNYIASPEPKGGKDQNNNNFSGGNQNVSAPNPNTQINIGPNPFTDMITIDFNLADAANVSISITDINGVLIKNIPSANYIPGSHSVQVSLGDLVPGTYYLKFFDGKTIQVQGIVKI